MKIAVEGCCHGELDKIYETLEFLERQNNTKVDLLLICGDFQAVRNRSDLQAMAVPPKYQVMNSFYKYYSGEKKAPVLTVFIGGNHEASNYLQELPYGGWVAPNIYYMGYANVLRFGGARIGGISGIYKSHDFNRGHYEHPPYNDQTKRSCYHVRNLEVFRLKQLKEPVDIMLSHDWPRGIYNYGNVGALLRQKKFFRDEVNSNTLGSPPLEELLHHMKPEYWFAAHLHCKFAAMVEHNMDDGSSKTTKFLSLDKCLPQRKFLQVIDLPHDSSKPLQLELDVEWMSILKSTNHLLNLSRANSYMPGRSSSERSDFTPTDEEKQEISLDLDGVFSVPPAEAIFSHTAPTFTPKRTKKEQAPAPQIEINPQTTLLCEMLGLTDPFAVFSGKQTHSNTAVNLSSNMSLMDDSAVAEDSMGSSCDDDPPTFIDTTFDMTADSSLNVTSNPDEISIGSDEEDEENAAGGEDGSSETPAKSKIGLQPSPNMPKTSSPVEDRIERAADPLFSPVHVPQALETMNESDKVCSANFELKQASSDTCGSPLAKNLDSSPLASRRNDSPVGTQRDSPSPATPSRVPHKSPPGKRTPDSVIESTTDSANAGSSEQDNSPARPKKFKRRNQSFYSSQEEDN